MGPRDSPNSVFGDAMGYLVANGVSRADEEEGWKLRSGAAITRAAGRTVAQRVASVMENPWVFIIWSALELALSLLWLHNPWPLPNDYVTGIQEPWEHSSCFTWRSRECILHSFAPRYQRSGLPPTGTCRDRRSTTPVYIATNEGSAVVWHPRSMPSSQA